MSRELSDVFKAKTRADKRKVLDKFDISKEDKNKFLNSIEDKGNGDSGESSNIEYLDVSNLPEGINITNLLASASAVKYYDGGDNLTIGTLFINLQDLGYNGTSNVIDKTVAIKVNWDELVYIGWKGYGILTLREFVEMDFSPGYFNDVPRITKEQFYSLE